MYVADPPIDTSTSPRTAFSTCPRRAFSDSSRKAFLSFCQISSPRKPPQLFKEQPPQIFKEQRTASITFQRTKNNLHNFSKNNLHNLSKNSLHDFSRRISTLLLNTQSSMSINLSYNATHTMPQYIEAEAQHCSLSCTQPGG